MPLLRIDRTGVALVGAILMVVTGAISLEDAAASVDVRTLVLLFSMMVIVAHVRMAGGLDLVVRAAGHRVRDPRLLLLLVVIASGVLSALFVNDTVCLVFTPLVMELAGDRRLSPTPFLLALATASNIGSAATPTGNPQNILISSMSGIPFSRFVSILGPVSLAGLALDAAVIAFLFRHQLRVTALPAGASRGRRPHRAMLLKTALVSAGVVVGFIAGLDVALVASGGAGVLLVTRRVRPRKVYAAVDWDLLMLFIGLFVIVGAGERAGLDAQLFRWLSPLGVSTVAGLSATAALLSNAVSNVPAVMLFTTVVPKLPVPQTSWLALAMSSTLAGNLTVLGSIANLIVLEGARRRGVTIGFASHARVGIPVTVLTLGLGIWWLA